MTSKLRHPLATAEVAPELYKCSHCRQSKERAAMAPDRHAKFGLRSVCRICRAKYEQRRYRENPPREAGRAWLADYRRRANHYGLPVRAEMFTSEELLAKWGNKCLRCNKSNFEVIDHIIPIAAGGPHTLQNVVPCCKTCNTKKYVLFDRWIIREYRAVWEHRHRRT